MKMRLYILSLFAVFSAYGKSETFNNSEVRSWTNCDNNVVHGKLVKYDRSRNSVYIARPLSEGGAFWYALNKLSADDVVFVNDEVANLNKVVLPENLYNDAYFNRSSYAEWKWYDPKYLVVEDPVIFNWSERRSRFRTANRSCWMTRTRTYEFGTHLYPRQRRKGFAPSHWNTSIINFSAILRQYGVSERDLAKLKWFYSKEDWMSKTSVIFRKFGKSFWAKNDYQIFFDKKL